MSKPRLLDLFCGTPSAIDGLERSAVMLNRFSKNALDAGIAEKLVAIAERAADQIVLAAEEALAKLDFLSAPQRTLFAVEFERALAKREAGPPDIEGHGRLRA